MSGFEKGSFKNKKADSTEMVKSKCVNLLKGTDFVTLRVINPLKLQKRKTRLQSFKAQNLGAVLLIISLLELIGGGIGSQSVESSRCGFLFHFGVLLD